MVNLFTVMCIFATCAVVAVSSLAESAPSHPPAVSPGPAETTVDCSSLIYDMMDCMEFLIVGGIDTRPENSCCSGFKTVLAISPDCICYALSNSASLGLDVNMTRVVALPSECRVSAATISSCHVAISPSGSPANSPGVSALPLNYPILPPTAQPPAATPPLGGAPSVPPSGIASAPPSLNYPILPPIVQTPAATTTLGGAPAMAPSSIASAPDSEVAEESGACAISATFSAFLLVLVAF